MRLYTDTGDEVILASGYWEAVSRLAASRVYEAESVDVDGVQAVVFFGHDFSGTTVLKPETVPDGVREALVAGVRNPYLIAVDAVVRRGVR